MYLKLLIFGRFFIVFLRIKRNFIIYLFYINIKIIFELFFIIEN